jgi:hypothetical protein
MTATVSSPTAPVDDGGRPSAAGADQVAFGQFLASARHRSGLALEDISATTKVAVRHLEALERGAIDQLPGGVYRRAWVKSYAAAVGLPPDATVEQFDRMFAPPPAPAEHPTAAAGRRPESRPQPPALPRRADYRYRLLGWGLPAAVLVAAASVALLRSEPNAPGIPEPLGGVPSAAGGDSSVLTGESGPRAEMRGNGWQRSDIVLVPDVIPEKPIADPRLVITSRPSGARVTVNGIGWGVTPITIRNLPPGPKLIRATKDGYIGREASVELDLQESGEFVRLTLQRRD